MQVCTTSSCCGLMEISELRSFTDPKDALWNFMSTFTDFEGPKQEYLGRLPYQVLFNGVRRFITSEELKMPDRAEFYSSYSRTFRQESYDRAVVTAKKEVLFGYAG